MRAVRRRSATRPVSVSTSKLIGYILFGCTNLIMFVLLVFHSSTTNSTSTTDNTPTNYYTSLLRTLPSKERLPFTPITIDNTNLNRMHSGKPEYGVYDFDWKQETRGQESIFISIPSLNDPDCNNTIASAFGESFNPDRIYFGVYEQNREDAALDCLDFSGANCPFHPVCSRLEHIRITRVDVSQSKGPTWGRYNADKEYNGQQFILVSDSHTLFRPYWDLLLLDVWRATNNEFAVITHYPKPDSALQNDLPRWYAEDTAQHPMSYHICGSVFESTSNHMPRNANGCYTHIDGRHELQSVLVPFWAAGFSFSKFHLRYLVKWDPHTTYIFHGEEFHFSSRAWTFGYDFYSPPFDILFHVYYDKKRTNRLNINHVSNAQSSGKRDAAEKRVNALWNLLELRTPEKMDKADVDELETYPLGDTRSLSDYWQFCGIDPVQQTTTVFETQLWSKGGLNRVPWQASEDDPVLHPEIYKNRF